MVATQKRTLDSYEFIVTVKGQPYAVAGVKGFEGDNAEANAKSDCVDRNAKAADMGIKTRYEVVPA